MKIHSTKKNLILLSILVVILAGLHYAAFSFIRNSGAEVSALERDVNSLRAQVLEFSKYSPEDMVILARSVTARFISRANFVDFIENIESEAKTQNVSVLIRSVDVESRSEDENDDKEIIRLKFETRGSWADTMRFVNYLEHLPYKVVLYGLGLSLVSEEGPVKKGLAKIPQWRGQVEISALKFK